ncbi:MAG: hypothetical protein GXO74_08330, partial [Calditrichaeota bacterium]|nr:hypothetical protein [Calditrichota bacterium]
RKPYGYVHFKKHRGIIAVRNPKIESDKITVKLSPDFGLCPHAASLVLERVYPTRWISPELYSSGGQVTLPLSGFETAVYEIYPLEEATEPLLAGAVFDTESEGENFKFTIRESGENVRLLNPEKVAEIQISGEKISLSDFPEKISATDFQEPKHDFQVKNSHGKSRIRLNLSLPETFERATLALLVENQVQDKKAFLPEVKVKLNGKKVQPKIEKQKGRWAWFKVAVKSGDSKIDLQIQSGKKNKRLNASASLWLIGFQQGSGEKLQIKMAKAPEPRPMPPMPWENGLIKKVQKICSFQMK